MLVASIGCNKDGRQIESNPLKGLMLSMNIMPLDKPEPAPEFELLSINGDIRNLRQYRGSVVLLSFWATW
ncbi:MAG: hypothetical protein Fur0020_15530 [Thermodesulfovibrionia bacterium]